MHSIQAKKQHTPGRRLDLRGWYTRKRKQRVDAEIRNILNLPRAAEAAGIAESRMTLPPVWSHKSEALAGDTIYLGHNHSVRSFILSATEQADPLDGKIPVNSPIGRLLLGRHLGDRVHLMTLDGDTDYTVLKII